MKHSQLLFTAYDVNFADNGVQFPWLALYHVTLPCCKGGWEM